MLHLDKNTVQGILLVLGNTEYPKFGEAIQKSEDLARLTTNLPWVNFEGFVKLVLLSRGSEEVPSVSCNIAGRYIEVDADFAEFIEGWRKKLVPKIDKWIKAEDSAAALAEGFAGILLDPKMTKEDSVAVFTCILSTGLCSTVQLIDNLVNFKKEMDKMIDMSSLFGNLGFGRMPIGLGIEGLLSGIIGSPVEGVIVLNTEPREDPRERVRAILQNMFGESEVVFADKGCPGCGSCLPDEDE